jgi:hypothetical protein
MGAVRAPAAATLLLSSAAAATTTILRPPGQFRARATSVLDSPCQGSRSGTYTSDLNVRARHISPSLYELWLDADRVRGQPQLRVKSRED